MQSLITICKSIRDDITMLEESVRELKNHADIDASELDQQSKSEIRGNAMLALRHLEDARMRLGKVIQHAEGGTSIYNKSTTQDA